MISLTYELWDNKGIQFIFSIDFSLSFGLYLGSLAHGLIIYEIA